VVADQEELVPLLLPPSLAPRVVALAEELPLRATLTRRRRASTAVIEDLLEGVRPPGALHAAIDSFRASFRDGAKKLIVPKKVALPALIVWGDRERHFDPVLANPPADWATNARVEHVSNGSHWVHHDEPAMVARLLLEQFR
jgi:pimeloyl-ACP methyl ester carboxylesterase